MVGSRNSGTLSVCLYMEKCETVVIIKANDALRHAFNLGKQAKLRLIKVVVRSEELTPNYEYAGTGNWRDDWRATLPECVDAFEPCFILFRLNTITEWILITLV
ncbi:hypothetical protein GCK32_013704, partial [Trichostrongylus colubriformis]